MHDLVRWRSHKVYLPVNVNLNTSVIKPMHSQWTLESHAFSATQNRWMENAWRDTGLLPILDGTFVPNPELSTMYVPPSIATAELAEQCDPPSDEESYSTSFSEAEQISDIDATVVDKVKQLEDINKQISDLQAQKTQISSDIASNNVKLESNKNNFLYVVNTIIDGINSDIILCSYGF